MGGNEPKTNRNKESEAPVIFTKIQHLIGKHENVEREFEVKIDAAKRTPGSTARELYAERERARAQIIEAITDEARKQLEHSRNRYANFT